MGRSDFRLTNQSARLMLRTRVAAIAIFAVGIVVYFFVKLDVCFAWAASASDYLPLHLVMTTKVAVLLYLHSPKDMRHSDHVLQVSCSGGCSMMVAQLNMSQPSCSGDGSHGCCRLVSALILHGSWRTPQMLDRACLLLRAPQKEAAHRG